MSVPALVCFSTILKAVTSQELRTGFSSAIYILKRESQ